MAKTPQQAASKWTASAPAAQAAYTAGVQNPARSWQSATTAAIPAMVAGFNDAANTGRISGGISRAGDAYWQSQSIKKAANFGAGLATGADNFTAAITKILAAETAAVNGLNPRGPVGSPQNYQRSQAVGDYLHQRRGTLGAR